MIFQAFGKLPDKERLEFFKKNPPTPAMAELLRCLRDCKHMDLVKAKPGGWWFGIKKANGRACNQLLEWVFISEQNGSTPEYRCYRINQWGREALSVFEQSQAKE